MVELGSCLAIERARSYESLRKACARRDSTRPPRVSDNEELGAASERVSELLYSLTERQRRIA